MSSLDDWYGNDVAKTMCSEAERLYKSKRYSEALVLINVAIENDDSNYSYFLTKARILRSLDRYQESREAFDRALELKPDDSEVLKSKAEMLYEWANSLNDKKKALEIITEAIGLIPYTDVSAERFWYLKGSIHDCMGEPIEAHKCYLIAERQFDEVRALDEQKELILNSKDTLINITGTQFYFGLDPFKEGQILDLAREPENEHDPDAIRAEINGETVGYVANSEYTLIEGITPASDIAENMKDAQKAEVLFIYFDAFVIAKLIV